LVAPFHGVNAGSNPAGDAILINDLDANPTNLQCACGAKKNLDKAEFHLTCFNLRNAVASTYFFFSAKYGGRYFARGGEVQTLEGAWSPRNIIIVEFRSMEQARAWYQSPENASALEVRDVALERDQRQLKFPTGTNS
jgi:uncharacterized protein (DUF1330 family)